ncbi:DUF6233 domain-containing protein [Streptomyces netropsis]|uniref:Uncharacterized protein n=1 Tax=Streptomyces netropsis TaxID=55404 RepID=A0A7W7PCR6_STRNE|nr:DUF6233 domain-containing protein [Streptomyces netropsis]MBB4885244.1 hypothetical protein [Streptomyces netropsis]
MAGQNISPTFDDRVRRTLALLLSRVMEQLFTPDERARIEAAARETGHSPRDWVRAVVLHHLDGGDFEETDTAHGALATRAEHHGPYRPGLEDALWLVTSHRRSGRLLLELHHAGCWVPKGGEDAMTTAEAREQLASDGARPCDACQPQRFLTRY